MAYLAFKICPVVALLFAAQGCASTQKSINETDMDKLKAIVEAMSEAGIAGYAEVELGPASLYAKQSFGFEGPTIRVRALANPKSPQ